MDSKLIRRKILKKASLPFVEDLSKYNDMFEHIISILSDVHYGKKDLYGDYFENIKDSSNSMNILRNFLEIEKKYIRANNILKKEITEDEVSELLLDTYSDLAIYSILGIGILGEIITKNNHEE